MDPKPNILTVSHSLDPVYARKHRQAVLFRRMAGEV